MSFQNDAATSGQIAVSTDTSVVPYLKGLIIVFIGSELSHCSYPIRLYHPLDGITNLKYKLLCFLTPCKKNSKRKTLAFNQDRCCQLALCLQLILFHCIFY
jgi:hypothetical protein